MPAVVHNYPATGPFGWQNLDPQMRSERRDAL
jgi:hypothetical protein